MVMGTPLETVARTLYGEARGAHTLDRLGVLAVIRERTLRPGWWGRDWDSVCRSPWQFSAWVDVDEAHRRNMQAMMVAETNDAAVWQQMVLLAQYAMRALTDRDVAVMFGVQNPGEFPTHYHDRSLSAPPKAWGTDLIEIRPRWESAFRWYHVRQGTPPRRR